MDNWTGTAGDDIVQAQNATLNTFDYIDGGAGQDTMVFVATNDVNVPVGATVKNIETINVLKSLSVILCVRHIIGVKNHGYANEEEAYCCRSGSCPWAVA